jgi:hypothetical protein
MADAPTPPPPAPGQAASSAPASHTEPLAIVSLVCAILSWTICVLIGAIAAIICGHMARSKIRRSNGALTGMNFALAGLIIAYLEIPMGVMGGIMLADMFRSERVRLHELAVEKKEITSDDGKLKLTASGFWVKTNDLNKDAALQIQNKSQDMYVMVFTDPKSTVGSMSLEQRDQVTRDTKLQSLQNGSATQPISLTIGGHPALQEEVSGIQKRANLVFLHTTVDDGDSFRQIVAWTTKSRWPKQSHELRDITDSFRSED